MTTTDGDAIVQRDGSAEGIRQLGRIVAGFPAGPGADWEAIADLATRQGVAPLLFWRLGQGGGDAGLRPAVPQHVLAKLREHLYTAAAYGILAEGQLARVLGALSRAKVPALVVKGAAVGAYYPDPTLRPYGDIDIMVPKAQLGAAEQALNALGYRCFASRDWWLDRFHHLPPMAGEGGGLLVELHWRLDFEEKKGRLPTEDLWARSVPWTVRDQPGLRLDVVDAVMYVCRHAVVQHRAHGAFRPLCDLVQLTRGWDGEQWEDLVRRTLRYGLIRPVFLMLVLAGEILDMAVPAQALSALKPSGTVPSPNQLVERLMGASTVTANQISVGAVQAAADATVSAGLKDLARSLFLPREGMAMVYGIPASSPRIWLAYLWRPIDLLARYGPSAWRALLGKRTASMAWQREVWLERWLRGDAPPE